MPPRSWPICTSKRHTSSLLASTVVARVTVVAGSGTSSSPGRRRTRSSEVDPQFRKRRLANAAAAAPTATFVATLIDTVVEGRSGPPRSSRMGLPGRRQPPPCHPPRDDPHPVELGARCPGFETERLHLAL